MKHVTHRDLKVGSGEEAQLPFYRYQGGLTTPPCSQIVTWSVMMAKIQMHSSQVCNTGLSQYVISVVVPELCVAQVVY